MNVEKGSMKDRFHRSIEYLRVSVTDRCNLGCVYCVPPRGARPVAPGDVLSAGEIQEVVRSAAAMGFRKVRLTGGEPLLRRDVVEIVALLAAVPGVEDLAMTTNGILLESLAAPLARAGLQRVNVSLDSLDAARYERITRGGDLVRVLRGLDAARAAGLWPIKLNCVVARSSVEPDARSVAKFGREHGFEARFIRRMNLARGEFWPVEGGGGGGDCPRCNRLRLTCDGQVKPCLFSDLAFGVRELGAGEALRQAVLHKPESGRTCVEDAFCTVGG